MPFQSLGQVKSAATLLEEAFASPAYTEFLDYNRRAWPEFLINRGRYAEALAAARDLTQDHSGSAADFEDLRAVFTIPLLPARLADFANSSPMSPS